jgi:hypothetical protein
MTTYLLALSAADASSIADVLFRCCHPTIACDVAVTGIISLTL